MEGKSVAKVGLLVLVATILAVVGYLYLSHQQLNTYLVRVHFKDTKGLLRQSVVHIKGVGIGEVKSVRLEQTGGRTTPLVELTIDKKYSIPNNYSFVIVSGLLISNPTIDVRPPDAAGLIADGPPLSKEDPATVEGAEAGSALDMIDPQLTKTISKLNASFSNIDAKLERSFSQIDLLLKQTNKLVINSNDTIVAAKGLISDPRFKANLLETTDNFKQLSVDTRRSVKDLTRSLGGIVKEGQPKLERLTDQGLGLITKLDDSIDNINLVVKKLTEQVSDPRLQSSLQETIELARSTISSTRQIASDVHQLTGDPTLQANLKESAANLKLTTERSAIALERLNNILDKVSGVANKVHTPKAPPVQLLVNAQEVVSPAHFRLDVDARIPLGQRNLFDLGLYDLGADTRLNLQGGTRISDNLLARYGLHASKLSLGLDYGKTPYSGFHVDLYDANHPRLDVKGLIRVNKNASIWAGADGILRGDPVPTIGVQFNN